jgi:protein-tyrosine-phosphatase
MKRTVTAIALTIIISSCMKQESFYPELEEYLLDIESEFAGIPESRKETLHKLGDYVVSALHSEKQARLVFICTHNSRRSQFGQLWAGTAARYYGLGDIQTFSGGTASTAFNPRAVAAIQRAGFQVRESDGHPDNPHYVIFSGKGMQSEPMFSKKFDDDLNPENNFCAVMVCTDADEACPIVPGAAERISHPYVDPKEFDGTEQEAAAYDERCRQIACEMLYTFRYVKNQL